MPDNLITFTPAAYQYPLLIKHLLHYPLVHAPDQEIVYRDLRRHTYREFRERIGRLASGLSEIGVRPGDVVAVLDWDSDRYHECYFAVPMMGAVLQTVNLSLAPEQLLYILNDARPSTLLVNADFLPLVEKLADKLPSVRRYVLMHDGKQRPSTRIPIECEYEEMLEASSPFFQFADFDENTRATTFHTTGTTGHPKGVMRTQNFLLRQHSALARLLHSDEFDGADLCPFANFALANLASGRCSLFVPDRWEARFFRKLEDLPKELLPQTL
ncbi:MAG TPA: AMP-binding protein, partial [Xanthobacteraceae bacterium]|nr:AMP-binding protein [Xanthobacteraceae bacterium]